MWQDTIVEAIHESRQRYSKEFNHDLKAIFTDLRQQQAKSARRVVTLSRPQGLKTRWSGLIKGKEKLNRTSSVSLVTAIALISTVG